MFSPSYEAAWKNGTARASDVVAPILGADRVAYAILEMIQAASALEKAKDNIPDYTIHDDADYYCDEQETFNRACDNLLEAIEDVTLQG